MLNIKPSDIEYPLYKYWIFYRFHVNHRVVDKKQLFKQKFKVFLLFTFLIISLIRYIFCLLKSKPNTLLPHYYFDIVQYFGAVKQLFYMSAIICHNLILFLLII